MTLAATTALGLLGVLGGWYGVSGQGTLRDQLPGLDLAVAGAVVAGLGNCGWLLAGRRAVGASRRALLVGESVPEPSPAAAQPRVGAPSEAWVQAPGMRRTHRPHCALVAGKAWVVVAPEAGPACAVCTEGEG